MKKLTLLFLIVLMLLTVGHGLHAAYAQDDEKKPPEFWLNDQEKAYVASIRATEANVRGNINYARLLLMDSDLNKAEELSAEITALKAELGKFCSISAPDEFKEIGTEYCNLGNEYSSKIEFGRGSFGFPGDLLIDAIRVVTDLERQLVRLEADLGKMSKKLTAQIADIAERREKAAELVEELFGKFCFIATAVYGTPAAEEIDVLRQFRDEVLVPNPAGRAFVIFYYRTSPPVAQFIAEHEVVRTIVREAVIDPIVAVVDYTRQWWSE